MFQEAYQNYLSNDVILPRNFLIMKVLKDFQTKLKKILQTNILMKIFDGEQFLFAQTRLKYVYHVITYEKNKPQRAISVAVILYY